ncbi:glutaredoxin family protein [Pseudoclavibacter caeni]|uniref:NrdH-redoxin n=1 Tax=Pseudoclavibacter caeni TaxID=908846 RepID=A0A7C8BPP5_9MICO|nr:glutaredoxin domain-containing protein [Pseudoclavibacter caeni]KAB1633605.1 NrdH-redoxin [Pseudoclavibacter caeni]NYJ96383.1 glutaredoxin [Pseudoclavibacter caeni]
MTAEHKTPITFYGAGWCGDCRRSKALLDRLAVPYEYVDLVADPDRAEEAHALSGRTNIPVLVFSDGSHQVEPTDEELETHLRALGLID